jgi:hypothetical protein
MVRGYDRGYGCMCMCMCIWTGERVSEGVRACGGDTIAMLILTEGCCVCVCVCVRGYTDIR